MWPPSRGECDVSIDIEADGPAPGLHSKLSLGAAALTSDGAVAQTFSAHLDPLPEAHGVSSGTSGRRLALAEHRVSAPRPVDDADSAPIPSMSPPVTAATPDSPARPRQGRRREAQPHPP